MSLIEEVKKHEKESYDKWFERWWEKRDLEGDIKQVAMEGYKGYILNLEYPTSYVQRRLRDERTTERIKDKLGKGFSVRYTREEKVVGNWFFGHDEKIHITW